MAAWLASTVRAGERGGLQDSDFWYAVAQQLLAPLLFAAAPSGATMTDVIRWVDLQDEEEPLRGLQKTREFDALQAFAASINREERTRSSAYTTVETVLAALRRPRRPRHNHPPTRDPPRPAPRRRQPPSTSAGPSMSRLDWPLFTALIEQTVARIYDRANRSTDRLTKPLLLVIDEAANIAPLPDLAQIASTARGVASNLSPSGRTSPRFRPATAPSPQTVINNHRAKGCPRRKSPTPHPRLPQQIDRR